MSSLDGVNASADRAPGFVWRLQSDEGNSTSIKAFDWDVGDSSGVIINMSVWESIDHLSNWVNGPMHRSVLLQRRKWFNRVKEATTALWWVREGHVPTVAEAEERVRRLRVSGPTPLSFMFRQQYEPTEENASHD